jgi:Leucine-rich repeat (LRR) protein
VTASVNRLGDKRISEIIPGRFGSANSMNKLELRHKKIEHLDSDVLNGGLNLKYIYLGYNKLQYLHPDTFLGLPNLQHVYSYSNRDLHIPTDRNFINSLSSSY